MNTENTETLDERDQAARDRIKPLTTKAVTDALDARFGGTWSAVYTDKVNPNWTNRRVIEAHFTQTHATSPLTPPTTFEVEYVERSKRLNIRPVLPKGVEWRHVGHGVTTPSATFAGERGSAGFLASLSRLYEDGRTFICDTTERAEKSRAYVVTLQKNLDRCAKALGLKKGEVKKVDENGSAGLYHYIKRGSGDLRRVEVKVYENDCAMNLGSIPYATAEKILKILKESA